MFAYAVLSDDISIRFPLVMPQTPVRATSISPNESIRLIKAVTFNELPVTSNTKLFSVLSNVRGPETIRHQRLNTFSAGIDNFNQS